MVSSERVIGSGSSSISLYAALFVAVLANLSTQALIAQGDGFYEKNAAKTIFRAPVEPKGAPPVEYFPRQEKKPEAGSEKGTASEKRAQGVPAIRSPLVSREEILSQFGDPSIPATIPGSKEAPAPFRAMMAALEVKDLPLARAYARQYLKYLKDVAART